MDWTTGRLRFDPRQRQETFPLTSVSRPTLRPTQPLVQWLPGVKRGRSVTLTTHPHPVPRSWMSRSYTSCLLLRLHICVVGLIYIILRGKPTFINHCALLELIYLNSGNIFNPEQAGSRAFRVNSLLLYMASKCYEWPLWKVCRINKCCLFMISGLTLKW
jgi:hypothetical protein